MPPGASIRLFALPAVPRLFELRWAWMLRRRPVLTLEQHAATTGVGEIEEITACHLCGSRRVQPLLRPGRPGHWGYSVVRCPDCGFLYRNPGIRPERVGELYGRGNYARFLSGRYARARQREYSLALDAFDPLFAAGDGRRLLDYGCGIGLFLEVARSRGFDGYGVDLSPDAVKEAQRRGLRAWLGAPRDVPEIAAGGFDVITLWSVLAHLPRPVEDLSMLRELLAPTGVLLVSTVNANSLKLKAYREDWGGFTPNHLVFFSPATLSALLARAGFAAVAVRPFYGRSVENGDVALTARQERRLRRTVERGNQGSMLRAVAFASPGGLGSVAGAEPELLGDRSA